MEIRVAVAMGGSPGLVVMGRDSRSEGCGFESQHRIREGHFFTYICCKNCNVCLKRPKINAKRGRDWPTFCRAAVAAILISETMDISRRDKHACIHGCR